MAASPVALRYQPALWWASADDMDVLHTVLAKGCRIAMNFSTGRLLRMSLSELLGAVMLVSVLLAACVTESYWLSLLLAVVSAVVGLYMVVTVIFGRSVNRVFAIGFIIGGFGVWLSTYFVDPVVGILQQFSDRSYVAEIDWGTASFASGLRTVIGREEILDKDSDEWVNIESPRGQEILSAPPPAVGQFFGVQQRSVPSPSFVLSICKSFSFIVFGYLGGRCAVFAYNRDRVEPSTSKSTEE